MSLWNDLAWRYHYAMAEAWMSRWWWTLVGFNVGIAFAVVLDELGWL